MSTQLSLNPASTKVLPRAQKEEGNLGTKASLNPLPPPLFSPPLQVGSIGLLFMGTIAAHCMGLLVQSSHKLREK